MLKKGKFDFVIIGFMIFATFFGAGNLIFPPIIGFSSGTSWANAMMGLVLSGIIFPMLAILSILNAGGSFAELSKKIAPWFNATFNLFAFLGIALIITIPRTAATTHELGIVPIFGEGVNIIITSIIFFALTFYFAIDKGGVADKIGKVLTPILLILLLFIVVKGVFFPIGMPTTKFVQSGFTYAFFEMYQTGDVLTGLLFATAFISLIKIKDYNDKEVKSITFKATMLSLFLLVIFYGGLLYIGAHTDIPYSKDMDRVGLLIQIVEKLFGQAGTMGLAFCIIIACFSTAVGATMALCDFIASVTNDKVSYKVSVAITCIVGVFQASGGVEKIINLAYPFFMLCYPMAIVLTCLGLIHKYVPKGVYRGSVLFAFLVSILKAGEVSNLNPEIFSTILKSLPLYNQGFEWLIPSIIGAVIGYFVLEGRDRVDYW